MALPFHFFFAFTGLLIFASWLYFPVSNILLKPLHDQHERIESQKTGLPHQRSGVAAPLASVDAMVLEAKRHHLIRTLFTDPYWAVAGVDLSLLASASLAIWAARTLARREQLIPLAQPAPPAADATEVARA